MFNASKIQKSLLLCITPTMSNPVKQSSLTGVRKEHYSLIDIEMIVHMLQRTTDNCYIMHLFNINLKENLK